MRTLLCVWIVSALIFSPGVFGSAFAEGADCDPRLNRALVTVQGNELLICGVITPEILPVVEADLDYHVTTARIESVGGHALYAIDIAQMLNDHSVTVTLSGLCASACVTMFAILDSVAVSPNAVFVYHGGLVGQVEIATRTFPDDVSLGELRQRTTNEIEQRKMGEAGRTHFVESVIGLRPECVGSQDPIKSPVLVRGRPYIDVEFDAWLPSRSTLVRWRQGRPTNGLDENYDQDATRRLSLIQGVNWGRMAPMTDDAQIIHEREQILVGPPLPTCPLRNPD